MTQPERYGRRKVSGMYEEWKALRTSIRSGAPIEQIEANLDACEEWIDYAFGENAKRDDEQ